MTVEEAAGFLRIGRGRAYELARRWEATDGREGLPVVRLGRLFRVPRHQLVRLVDGDTPATAAADETPQSKRSLTSKRNAPASASSQLRLLDRPDAS
jgi:excisionase family DNA binding protein